MAPAHVFVPAMAPAHVFVPYWPRGPALSSCALPSVRCLQNRIHGPPRTSCPQHVCRRLARFQWSYISVTSPAGMHPTTPLASARGWRSQRLPHVRDAIFSPGHSVATQRCHRHGVDLVLLLEHPRRHLLWSVGRVYRDDTLHAWGREIVGLGKRSRRGCLASPSRSL